MRQKADRLSRCGWLPVVLALASLGAAERDTRLADAAAGG